MSRFCRYKYGQFCVPGPHPRSRHSNNSLQHKLEDSRTAHPPYQSYEDIDEADLNRGDEERYRDMKQKSNTQSSDSDVSVFA